MDLVTGAWVVRNLFDPGTTLQIHKHTGHVYAFTQTGSWHYLESPEVVNATGSYLYEPAGSIHTLNVPHSNDGITDVWFATHGANLNLNLDAASKVELVVDAAGILACMVCEQQHGVTDPPVVVVQ